MKNHRRPPPRRRFRAFIESTVFSIAFISNTAASAATVFGVLSANSRAGLPQECPAHVLQVHGSETRVLAANELLWKAHPEINRRQIRLDEFELQHEWWSYNDQIDQCWDALNRP